MVTRERHNVCYSLHYVVSSTRLSVALSSTGKASCTTLTLFQQVVCSQPVAVSDLDGRSSTLRIRIRQLGCSIGLAPARLRRSRRAEDAHVRCCTENGCWLYSDRRKA